MATPEEPTVIEVEEFIKATSEQAWSILTDIRAWRQWWSGHRLKQVLPTWKRGAILIWDKGRDAVVFAYKPGELLDFGGNNMGIQIHRYFRLSQEAGGLRVVYGFSVKGADMGEPSEARQKMADTLRRLKRLIERGPKRWWKFWK